MVEHDSHVNGENGRQQAINSNELKAFFKSVEGLVPMLLWSGAYTPMLWGFEQAKVEERLGREVTLREKSVYLDERLTTGPTRERFHQVCEALVTDSELRQQLHQAYEEVCEQAEIDEALRQIAQSL